jgi:hypothetical protein
MRSIAAMTTRSIATMVTRSIATMLTRSIVAIAAVILGLIAVVPRAHAERHEVYWQAGADFLNGPRELIAGLGSGPGYRFHVSESWQLASEVRFLMVAGNRVSVALGGEYGFGSGLWRPSIGIFSHVYFGHKIAIVDSDDPEPVALPGIAFALRLSPLNFSNERYTATALAVSPAVAVTTSPFPVGFSITLLAVGARF